MDRWHLRTPVQEPVLLNLWFDAIFELAWQGQPDDRLYAEQSAPTSSGSIARGGNGLFPRIPKVPEFVSGKVVHEYGHPVQITSTLKNIVLASIAAIDELLDRGTATAEQERKQCE